MIFERIIEGQGLPLMFVGMSVVFMGLVVLMFMMMGLKRIYYWIHCLKAKKTGTDTDADICATPEGVPGVVIAAIAITLILEEEAAHDEESMVLTLRALPKPYSNWWMNRINQPWKAQLHSHRQVKIPVER